MAKLPSYESLTTAKGFFSLTPILSRGKHLNIVCGQRSSGKSTGTALFVLREFLATGGKDGWIYTRRTKDETELTCQHFFDNAVAILQNEGVNVNVFYSRGSYFVEYEGETKEAGRVVPLSLENKYKSDNLSPFKWIIFDEAINKNGSYLGGKSKPIFEYQCLLSLFQTCDRGINEAFSNNTYIIALANLDTFFCPLFMGCGADRYLNDNVHFCAPRDAEWAVQIMREEDSPSIKEFEQSVGFKLSDRRTQDYAYRNMAKESYKSDFVCKMNEPMDQICNLVYDGNTMGMYYSWKSGVFYIDNKPNNGKTYALTSEDHSPNYYLAMSATGAEPIRQLKVLYEQGRVRFASNRIKNHIDNYLKFII